MIGRTRSRSVTPSGAGVRPFRALWPWAAIRRADLRPGARIAVVGIGGLGHLAIQYAKASGFHVTAVTHSPDKPDLARQLGADDVVSDGAGLKEAGGADLLMHTSSSHAAVADAMQGLKPWGKVVVMGIAFDEMTLPALPLVSHNYQIMGSAHTAWSTSSRPSTWSRAARCSR